MIPIWIRIDFENEEVKEKAIKLLKRHEMMDIPGISTHVDACSVCFASYMEYDKLYEHAIALKTITKGLYSEFRFDGWTNLKS